MFTRSILKHTTRRRAIAVWLMALLMMFSILAPTITKALPSNGTGPGTWVEVCTASGTKWVLIMASDMPEDGPTGAHGADHCPFCLPQFQFYTGSDLGMSVPIFPPRYEDASRRLTSEPLLQTTQWRPDLSRAPPPTLL